MKLHLLLPLLLPLLLTACHPEKPVAVESPAAASPRFLLQVERRKAWGSDLGVYILRDNKTGSNWVIIDTERNALMAPIAP